MARKIEHTADDKVMTLDELGAFVQEALRSGANGSEVPTVRLKFGTSKLASIAAEVKTNRDSAKDDSRTAH